MRATWDVVQVERLRAEALEAAEAMKQAQAANAALSEGRGGSDDALPGSSGTQALYLPMRTNCVFNPCSG